MNEDLQYDCTLGGQHEIPDRLPLMSFTAARAKEIQAIKHALQTTRGTKLAFQRLPKHMRRRVMSHNVKRLPRRLREIHLNQLKKSGMSPKPKRPSRKYRRRPHTLLDKYARRQYNYRWLETHIWHAKRFHMTEKWGYRLADGPCDKAFRACYRATSKHCLVQDISYFSCIEISGRENILLNGFKSICNPNVGLSIGAKAYTTGKREGQTVLFYDNKGIIKKAIGTVYFNWKPTYTSNTASIRVIWLWVHAAYYNEVLNLLTNCFDLTAQLDTEIETHVNEETDVKLIELRNHLNRFRLTGPLSFAILHKALKTITLANTDSKWFKDYLKVKENSKCFLNQCEYWRSLENISSASEAPPHSTLALVVCDPRFNMPQTRTKATLQWSNVPNNIEILENLAAGPIWDSHIRNNVRENKVSNAKFAEMRSKLLVPGTELEEIGEAIPIMLIQRPGNQSQCLGYGSGWDLIVPSGWGNTFWLSLIMWGGRAGGLREFNSILFESGKLPFLMPDTISGIEEENNITQTYKQNFFRLPPNKRPNYIKYGITHPFSFNWKILIENWKLQPEPLDDFFILRDKKLLLSIQQQLESRNNVFNDTHYNLNCIVPVRLKLKRKGAIKIFATICLPEPHDIIQNKEPMEPLQKDKNQGKRQKMRHGHRELLKRLRHRRIRAKRKGNMIPKDVEMLKNYQEQMRKLWLPEEPILNIRMSCSREIMGFVVNGNFSFTQAHNFAVGYVTIGAIKVLSSQSQSTTVLLRNTTSRQYRTASLEIIV